MNVEVMCRFSTGDHLMRAVGFNSSRTAESLSITFGASAMPVNKRMNEHHFTGAGTKLAG